MLLRPGESTAADGVWARPETRTHANTAGGRDAENEVEALFNRLGLGFGLNFHFLVLGLLQAAGHGLAALGPVATGFDGGLHAWSHAHGEQIIVLVIHDFINRRNAADRVFSSGLKYNKVSARLK